MSYITIRRPQPEKSQARKAGHEPAQDAGPAAFESRVRSEVERLRQQAEAEGRRIGEALGAQAAHQQEAEKLRAAIAAVNDAARQFEAPLQGREADIAEMVTNLAFVLARHVVGAELKANSESVKLLVLQLVREAAAERNPHQSIIVRLNPADQAAISADELLENTRIIGDPQITRGGAFVEITSPNGDPIDKVEWDATVETRLTSIQQALAIEDDADTEADKDGAGKAGPLKHGAGKDGSGKDGSGKSGVAKNGPVKASAGKSDEVKSAAGKNGAGKNGAAKSQAGSSR